MKFGPVPLELALGKTLGHNIHSQDGHRLIRKGKILSHEDIEKVRKLGRQTVYVAELDSGDLDENTAAIQIARLLANESIRLSKATTGRVNLLANQAGVLRIQIPQLHQLNSLEDLTIATLPTNQMVTPGKMVATVKILPYAIPSNHIDAATKITAVAENVIKVSPTIVFRVGLILSGAFSAQERISQSFESALQQRINLMGANIERVDFVSLEEESDEYRYSSMISQQIESGCELIILAGDTAVMDRYDIAPRAIGRAGGQLICYGAPVDPGNLLLLAQVGSIPILGAPGCARSPKLNVIDLVLPRLLAGEILTRDDVIQFGHGGLLEDVPERPLPRSRLI